MIPQRRGQILGFNPRGYVDRSVPVLRISSPDGSLRGVLFGYACHGTTLPSDSLIVSPDYPGYARDEIQRRFPKAEAVFIGGLGGSANPYPRTSVEDSRHHGGDRHGCLHPRAGLLYLHQGQSG